MEESKDLKAGETVTYSIGGKTVTLKPVTLGKMKRAMAAFTNKETGDAFTMMQMHIFEILNNGENDFATKEWIDENVTLPMGSTIVTDSRRINGLDSGNFFQVGATPQPKTETRDLVEAPPTPSV